MKLNLGCGNDIRDGYVNIDLNAAPGVAIVADIQAIPLASSSVREIVAQDVLEHISWRHTRAMIAEWRRVLIPDGRLCLRTPDLQGIVELYRSRPPGWQREQAEHVGVDPIVDRLYGGQDFAGNFHHAIFDQASITQLLVEAGFVVGDVGPDGVDVSNMTVVAFKRHELETGSSLPRNRKDGPFDSEAARRDSRITWVGPLLGPSGYAQAGRSYVRGLAEAGASIGARPLWDCPMTFVDTPRHGGDETAQEAEEGDGWTGIVAQVNGVRRKLRVRSPADKETLDRLAAATLQAGGGVCIFQHPPADADGLDFIGTTRTRYRDHQAFISYTTFETDGLPTGWVEALEAVDEVWVPTHFNLETFARAGVDRDRIHVIPHAFDISRYRPDDTEALQVGKAAGFTFLSIFEWTHRKGWDVLLRAYLSAFSREDDVRLLLRAYQGGGVVAKDAPPIREQLVGFVRDLGYNPEDIPRIDLLEEMIPAEKMPALYRAGDAFVLPTRGEGWGLPLTEALLMHVPVIATRWSGQLEFLNDKNAYLIDIKGIEAVGGAQVRDSPLYAGQRWAEPSSDHLADLMRHVVAHRDEAKEKARRGRREIAERFNEAAVARRIIARVETILRPRVAPAIRRRPRVLLQARPNLFELPGGDSEVVVHSKRALEAQGYDVAYSSDAAVDLSAYDLVHIINAEEPFAINAGLQRVPFVVTPLYEDMQRYVPRAMAMISAAQHIHARNAPPTELSNEFSRILRGLDKRLSPVRTPRSGFISRFAAALTASGKEEAQRINAELAPRFEATIVHVGFEPPTLEQKLGDSFADRFHVRDFVLCVGRLESRKNQLALIAALAEEEIPLVFVNSTTVQPEYEMLCKRWSRRAPTIFTGRLDRALLHSAYHAAKVHALPSWFELPGLVTLEAAWQGLNVVASTWGTIDDYLGDRVFTCEPDDIPSIRSAVLAALDAPPQASCQEELSRFSWSKAGEALGALYERVLIEASTPEGHKHLMLADREAKDRLERRMYRDLAEQAISIDPRRAYVLASELLIRDPHDVGVHAIAARAALTTGRLPVAQKHLLREIDLAPLAGAETFLYLALCLRNEGDQQEASSMLRDVEACFPFAKADTRRLFTEYQYV